MNNNTHNSSDEDDDDYYQSEEAPLPSAGNGANTPKLKFRLNGGAGGGNAEAGPSSSRDREGSSGTEGTQGASGMKIKLKGKLAEKGTTATSTAPSSSLKLKLNVRPPPTSQPLPSTPTPPAPSLRLKLKPLAATHAVSKPAIPSPLAGSPISARSFLASPSQAGETPTGKGRKLKLSIKPPGGAAHPLAMGGTVKQEQGSESEGESSGAGERDEDYEMKDEGRDEDGYSPQESAQGGAPSSEDEPDHHHEDDDEEEEDVKPILPATDASVPPPSPAHADSSKKPRKPKAKKWVLSKKRKTKSKPPVPNPFWPTNAGEGLSTPSTPSPYTGASASPQPGEGGGFATATPSREGTSGVETPGGEGMWTPGVGTPTVGGKGKPYLRVKKPLRECLKKIMVELKRKDVYGLFYDPVDPVEYPSYFETIGGAENAMDFSTMDAKIEDRMYRSMGDFEVDINKMITACEVFNGEGSHAYKNAGTIKTLAIKLMDRYRPIIRTPSPSPVRQFSTAAATPAEGASASPGARSASPPNHGPPKPTVPPKSLIPEAMLLFPPGSDVARAVGYYATGGKRARTKKEVRAREKFDGQWREWYTEGDRNLIEADDVTELFMGAEGSGKELGFVSDKVEFPKTIDWKDPAMRSKELWVAPLVYVGLQREESPPPFPTRPVGALDYGKYGDLGREFGIRRTDPNEESLVQTRIRRDAAVPDPWDYLKEMTTGEGLTGEAYLSSVEAFVRGAEVGVKRNAIEAIRRRRWEIEQKGKRKREQGEDGERESEGKRIKLEADAAVENGMEVEAAKPVVSVNGISPEKSASDIAEPEVEVKEPDYLDLPFAKAEDGGLGCSLSEHVHTRWRGGFIRQDLRKVADEATDSFRSIKSGSPSTPPPDQPIPTLVKSAIERVPILQEIATYSAKNEGVDLASLLHSQADFGQGSGPGPGSGPGRAAWFQNSLEKAGKQIVQAEERRVKRGEEGVDVEEEARLRQLRLDLLSLAKNVPVYELKPMTQEEAERLPSAVRGLIKVIPAK